MSATNDGGPAFPLLVNDGKGLSIRDWFAGQALAGMTAEWGEVGDVAETAYVFADAMLAERAKVGGGL